MCFYFWVSKAFVHVLKLNRGAHQKIIKARLFMWNSQYLQAQLR